MSNAIQQIADNMLYLWEEAISHPVKMVRIVINPGDESMLKAFYDYMLAIDSDEEDMVFVIALPFMSVVEYSDKVLRYIERQIEYWNDSDKPEDIIFERIDWTPDFTLGSKDNPAQLVVENFNRLAKVIVGGTDMKCSFVFDIEGTQEYEECRFWFEQALSLPFNAQMVWGISDIIGQEQFGDIMSKYPKETTSIYPPINMDEAVEKLAEQAANEDTGDPGANAFRIMLVKLMNSVKKGDAAQTEFYARKCLDMALVNVKKGLKLAESIRYCLYHFIH